MSKLDLMKMILPPKETTFYNLFEESTNVCFDTAKLFLEIMNEKLNEDRLIRAKNLKHKSNDLAKQTLFQLNKTFITPIDREDIQHIATLLNKITKRIVRACVNLRVYRLAEHNENMIKQAATLLNAVEELKFNVALLKQPESKKEILESNERMREIESHGDVILYLLMDDLFIGKYDAITVIKLRDIYKDIENALDTCFSVSDSIVNVVIKHG